jgi:prepilin-type N-terminal cleavage/methylation domain-containing protein
MIKYCDKGLTLVEVLIILAILSIAAAIAIPSIWMSRQIANEAGAIQGCRVIASAELAHAAMRDQQYADLAALVELELLDPKYIADAAVAGYSYALGDVEGTTLDGPPPDSFGFVARPERGSGRFLYAVAPDGIVRYQGALGDYTLPDGATPGSPVDKEEEEPGAAAEEPRNP